MPEQLATKYFDRLGKLNLWNGIRGINVAKANDVSHFRNREAEEAHARKVVWGWDGSKNEQIPYENTDMGDTVLGDITNQHPPAVVYPPQSNALPIIAGLALAAAIPTAAGIGVYMMNQNNKPDVAVETPKFDDTTVSLGLGHIEDYQK